MAKGNKMEDAATRIIEFRLKHRLTVQQLADYLNVKTEVIYRWESGRNSPQSYMECALLGVIVKMRAEKIRQKEGRRK